MMATAEQEIEHPNIVLLSESKRRIERSAFRMRSEGISNKTSEKK